MSWALALTAVEGAYTAEPGWRRGQTGKEPLALDP